jgi:hypothetical protein
MHEEHKAQNKNTKKMQMHEEHKHNELKKNLHNSLFLSFFIAYWKDMSQIAN